MEPRPDDPPKELRCSHCKKLLAIGRFVGWVEIHCHRCGAKVTFGN